MGDTNNDILGFFKKHLVPLCVIFTKGGKACPFFATAFILSAEDEWFLVTAGHVAEEIKSILTDPNYSLVGAKLCDIGGLNAKHSMPIPFDLTPEKFIILGNEKTYDYAVIFLDPYYIRLLERNGVEPLDEQVWLYQPIEPEFFTMLGVAKQMVSPLWNEDKSVIDGIGVATTLHRVDHSPQRPKGIEEKNAPRWYGYISTDSSIDDIVGMSGAPIFAFKHTDGGGLKYWLIGVQSSWNHGNKAIAACPAQNLGLLLSNLVKEIRDLQSKQKIETKTPKRGNPT
ncbi:hypothetical protein ACFL2X_03735 [Candidatus Latescibacterota bacterium]